MSIENSKKITTKVMVQNNHVMIFIPPVTENQNTLKLTPKQAANFSGLINKAIKQIETGEIKKPGILTRLLKSLF